MAYFGSYTETDPVTIAAQGVAKFKKERFDVIIVDTSGRHKQETELFREMVQIGEAVQPDQTVMILDASIGEHALLVSSSYFPLTVIEVKPPRRKLRHSRTARTSVPSSSPRWMAMRREEVLFLRESHYSLCTCGLLTRCSVAATKTPIIFLGVGEHLHDLDKFSPQPFISKLLGLGDVQGLMEHMQDIATQNPDKQKEMAKKLEEGKLSIRDWKEQIQNVMNMYAEFYSFAT